MSISSSEEGSWMAGHHATSSGLESTGSLFVSLPSDSSDAQTEITPPTSPTPSEGKMRTPGDILDASRRLGRTSASTLQGDSGDTPAKVSRQLSHRAALQSIIDEAGYDADGDGDGDVGGDEDGSSCVGAGTTTTTKPVRRPGFLRIDTRQHRRVASMLATRCPTSPEPGCTDAHIPRPPLAKLAILPSIRSKAIPAPTANAESYELRRRPRAELVGLGIGFPENHSLGGRAFSMPAPTSAPPISDFDEPEEKTQVKGLGRGQAWRAEWFPSSLQTKLKKKRTSVGVYMLSPVRLARPTSLEMSPSQTECSPVPTSVGAFCFEDAHNRSEVIQKQYPAREGCLKSDLS